MPVTRSDLKKQYNQNNKILKDNLINEMFNCICNDVNKSNNYGITTYNKNLRYQPYWCEAFSNRLLEMLKEHFIDSKIVLHDASITVDWTLLDENITEPVCEVQKPAAVTNVDDSNAVTDDQSVNDDENNIKINIIMPSPMRTRSSRRK